MRFTCKGSAASLNSSFEGNGSFLDLVFETFAFVAFATFSSPVVLAVFAARVGLASTASSVSSLRFGGILISMKICKMDLGVMVGDKAFILL